MRGEADLGPELSRHPYSYGSGCFSLVLTGTTMGIGVGLFVLLAIDPGDDKGGIGFERVKEVMMTPEGARLYFESEEGQRMKALLDGGFRAQAQAEQEARALLGDVVESAPSFEDEYDEA